MIPQNLHWAFEEGHRVYTLAGTGKTKIHRLANDVLPSGKISTGYPSDNFTNETNKVQPQVPPGTYSVFISVVRNTGMVGAFAFVTLKFTNAKTVSWEAVGRFFTDSGDGCICDVEVTELLSKKRKEMSREAWGQLKTGALHDGDGNLILDEKTGANAIIFRTGDWSYNCFIGRDNNGQISSFVIDGRVHQLAPNPFKSFLKLFKPKPKA
jgi:hypothetical protein